ncbi:hypothetical protein F5J12DRAFT_728322, partial [Pisolithus orientalis]|uniref:uncharacterized protein n=1 Tax=Pisolithus orientalis TaxID=936130 RepID=UPI0022247388
DLTGYPMGIGEATGTWLRGQSIGKSLLCSDWRAGKQDKSVNVDGLEKVIKHMQATAEQVLGMKVVVDKIGPVQLAKAVHSNYMQMAGEYCKAKKNEVEVVETVLGHAQMKSHVQSQESEECNSKWKDSKYDTAFILNVMSDDDDDPNHVPGESLAYMAMEPEW